MNNARKHEFGVGILVIVAMGLLAYMAVKIGGLRNVGEEITVNMVIGDAAGLSEGAAVRIAGVQVGQIGAMSVIHDKAQLTTMVAKSAQLREDATIQVRARSILGEKYLEITPYSTDAPLVKDGATLTVSKVQTEIDELVNSLGPLVNAVDADAVNAAVQRLSAALEEDPERIANMLKDVETILGHGAEASASLPALIADTRSALETVQGAATDVRPLIQRTNRIVSRVDEATQALPQMTSDLQATLQETRALVSDGRTIMEQMQSSTDNIQTILDNVSEIDKWELRRLLREEGILIRLKKGDVEPSE
jgi:phospholipid/cholesterol/gamma-HCH transport system substrate-binding protein